MKQTFLAEYPKLRPFQTYRGGGSDGEFQPKIDIQILHLEASLPRSPLGVLRSGPLSPKWTWTGRSPSTSTNKPPKFFACP